MSATTDGFRFAADAGEADIAPLSRIIHHAFAGPLDGCEKWVRESGLENWRLLRADPGGVPVAGLLRVPMGQHFGGRSVPMLGIAGVAVAPEARGRGLARRLMQATLREAASARSDGAAAISCLYPSTPALYRQVGYELAGHRFFTTMPVGRIDVRERGGGEIRPLTDEDDAAVRACYAGFAAAFEGTLDRGAYCWSRVRESRGTRYAGFGVTSASGGLDGYVYFSQERNPRTGYHDVMISDLAFVTADAGRRLLSFLADFATTAESAVFFGGPMHPLVSLMASRHYSVEKRDYWMVRVLDVARAISARGFPAGVRSEVAIDIADDLITENTGTWMIRVADGRASATRSPASSDALRCDIGAIAPLYSGLYTVRQLALLGRVQGSPAAIAAADATFRGAGTPWMSDMF